MEPPLKSQLDPTHLEKERWFSQVDLNSKLPVMKDKLIIYSEKKNLIIYEDT